MYTHKTVSSNQYCFHVGWWPVIDKDKSLMRQEEQWPLMMFESGQINRVNKDNLKPVKN